MSTFHSAIENLNRTDFVKKKKINIKLSTYYFVLVSFLVTVKTFGHRRSGKSSLGFSSQKTTDSPQPPPPQILTKSVTICRKIVEKKSKRNANLSSVQKLFPKQYSTLKAKKWTRQRERIWRNENGKNPWMAFLGWNETRECVKRSTIGEDNVRKTTCGKIVRKGREPVGVKCDKWSSAGPVHMGTIERTLSRQVCACVGELSCGGRWNIKNVRLLLLLICSKKRRPKSPSYCARCNARYYHYYYHYNGTTCRVRDRLHVRASVSKTNRKNYSRTGTGRRMWCWDLSR